jgi:hypothetical protein
MIVIAVTYFYLNHQEFMAQRHHLLCEILQPGMSKDEVLSNLQQVGKFTMNEVDSSSGFVALDINYTDPRVVGQYGYFSVVFIDSRYVRAVVPHGSDNPEYICDLYQASRSVTISP